MNDETKAMIARIEKSNREILSYIKWIGFIVAASAGHYFMDYYIN